MKKSLQTLCFILFSVWTLPPLFAQGVEDAMRFATMGLGGSTKSLGSANAIGAIGGSFAAASINPAGLGIMRQSDLHFGFNINSAGSQSTYLGSPNYGETSTGIGISDIGLTVFQNIRDKSTGLKNLVWGIGYNRNVDYRKDFTFTGQNTVSSFTDFLAEQANGTDFSNLNRYGLPYLAFESYLIEPKLGKPDSFSSAIRSFNTNVNQTAVIQRTGSGGDINLSLAANYEHKVYIGGGLVFRRQTFTELLTFIENDNQPLTDTNDFAGLTYSRYLNTKTFGVGINLGILLKATENWRFGVSFSSPMRTTNTDLYTQSIAARYDRARDLNIPEREYFIATPDDNFDNAPDTLRYRYRLAHPGRINLSAAYVFDKRGYLSIDVERVDFSKTRLKPKDENYIFLAENNQLENNFQAVYNVRIGGELTYGKYRFRGGFAHYPASFQGGAITNKGLNRNFYTLGAGLIHKKYALNAALVISSAQENYQPYTLTLRNQNNIATVRSTNILFQIGATIEVN